MRPSARAGGPEAEATWAQVMIVSNDSTRVAAVAAALEGRAAAVRRVVGPAGAVSALRETWPDVVILGEPNAPEAGDLRAAARQREVQVVDVVDDPGELEVDPAASDGRQGRGEPDDWVAYDRLSAELPARIARLLRRRPRPSDPARANRLPIPDAHFFSLVIHDLRTPLNVIGLSLRMINQAVPKGDADLDEDLRFVEENFKQIERMLSQLSDFFRLMEAEAPPYVMEFSPRTLVGELLEGRTLQASTRGAAVRLEVHSSCPPEAALDLGQARMALQHAVSNALAAADGGAVVVRLRGEGDRWIIEIATDRPPPPSVQSTALRPHVFERLSGSAAERRGIDLAIAARVSEGFGGSARLDVAPGRGTAIVFDWPVRQPEPTVPS